MKPLIVGAKGFIGSHFYHHFKADFPDLLGTHYLAEEGFVNLDLANPELHLSVSGYRYALITGGMSHLLQCEENPDKSYQCNVEGPIKLGKELIKKGVIPIFFSTDYVFDGREEVYHPNSPLSPLNEYGRQKAELERQAVKFESLVVRLSKVYGLKKADGTLFDAFGNALKQGLPIRAASDQVFAPISIEDVVKGVESLMIKNARGIVNVAGPVYASRLEMARAAAVTMGLSEQVIEEIKLKDLNEPFERPCQVRLSSAIPAMGWQEGMKRVMRQYEK